MSAILPHRISRKRNPRSRLYYAGSQQAAGSGFNLIVDAEPSRTMVPDIGLPRTAALDHVIWPDLLTGIDRDQDLDSINAGAKIRSALVGSVHGPSGAVTGSTNKRVPRAIATARAP